MHDQRKKRVLALAGAAIIAGATFNEENELRL